MERMNFVRIMTTALVLCVMTSAPGALAETCLVDLEEEIAVLDQLSAIHVGRDDGGLVLCLGPMEGTTRDFEPPRVVARVAPEGPCVTEAGESGSRSEEVFTEVVVSVSGQTPALLRASAGLVCDDLEGMSPYVEAGQTTLREYTDVLAVDEGMPVEVYNIDNYRRMTLELEENFSAVGGGIRASSTCEMDRDDYFGIYGVYIYNNIAYTQYLLVCEILLESYICIESAPDDEWDSVEIEVTGNGSYVATPASTTTCTGLMSVGGWSPSWDGHMELTGTYGDDVLVGADGDDTINGNNGGDTLYGSEGADTIHGGSGNDRLYGDDGNDHLYGDSGEDSLWGNDGEDTLSTSTCSSCTGEFASGGNDDDLVYGSDASPDVLWGGPGDDDLEGGSGNDTIFGHAGDDYLLGGSGNDSLNGGLEDVEDYCSGWTGTNTCTDCEDGECNPDS